MALHSGNEGTATFDGTELCQLSEWTLDYEQGVNETVTACSSPWNVTSRGNKKITGTLRAKNGDVLEGLADTDELVSLVLLSYSGATWSGEARIGRLTTGANIETGVNQEVSVSFVSDGAWTTPA